MNDLEGDKKSRWVIPSGRTLILVIRFFSKTTGNYEGKLNFENFFGLRRYSVELKGISDVPLVSSLPKNLYWSIKKSRPLNPPESYLSKVFVTSE
jgi:hypothetical protein